MPSSSTQKKNLSPPVQLGQSISEMSQVWCVKHAAWTCVYIYIYAWWYDWWSLCTYYNFIDMIDDACVLLHLMKNDVRTVCIGYYKTIQHCKTISKSVEILQCSISYYYILYKNMLHGSMTQKLRKKHGEKKKTSTVSPCPTSCLIFSSFETSTPVLLLSSVTSISAAFPR